MKFEEPYVKYSTIEELLKKEKYFLYTNVGFSMMPLIRQRRDIIEIRPLNRQPQKYDVILYKRSDKYILHRILRILPTEYLVAGDHNTFVERDVTDDMIIGVMTRIIRNGKSIYMTDWRYRLYVHLWCDAYPIRMWIIRAKQWIRSIQGHIKRRIKGMFIS